MGDATGLYELTSSASSSAAASLPVNGMYSDGIVVQFAYYGGSDSQKWTITVAN